MNCMPITRKDCTKRLKAYPELNQKNILIILATIRIPHTSMEKEPTDLFSAIRVYWE